MADENPLPYRVVVEDDRYCVRADNDQQILACGDERSAQHYVSLLNKAYQRGYRAGYRDARRSHD
jgi:hypothetical protein